MFHVKRWVVTYTKHVKQKRKVYQDGVLELDASSRKVILYDDGDKLIDSRSLKKDEIIEVGGSLAFEAHLVDIGDLEPNNKNLENYSAKDANFKLTERTGKQGKREILEHITPTKLPKNVLSNASNCSKKEEPLSSENKSKVFRRAPFYSLNESSSVKEWNVLYTSQVTQKAKKYHDGILRVKQCDSHTNQVILMSEDGSQLSNKYLKSIESIKSGSNCDFPNYLVEICELRLSPKDFPEKSKESPSKQIPNSSFSNNIKLTRTFKLQEKTKKSPPKEIQASSCPNNIKSTSTCKLQGDSEKPPLKQISTSNCSNNIELTSNHKLQEDKQKSGFEKIVDSTISKFVWGQANKPLRDVSGILSTLKKPVEEVKHDDSKLVGKQVDSSPSPDLIFLDVKNQKSTELMFPMKNYLWENVDARDNYNGFEGATQGIHCKMSNYESSQMEQKSDVEGLHEDDTTFQTSDGGPRSSDIVSLAGNNEGDPSLINIKKYASDVSRQSLEENEAVGSTKDFSHTSRTGASNVDPIMQQFIDQTNIIKQEEMCIPVQKLDTLSVSSHSDFQILSNECVYADDIPTFDLGF